MLVAYGVFNFYLIILTWWYLPNDTYYVGLDGIDNLDVGGMISYSNESFDDNNLQKREILHKNEKNVHQDIVQEQLELQSLSKKENTEISSQTEDIDSNLEIVSTSSNVD
ncbi:hypothetical protein M0813_14701 [Anaeramoeba flamelloides]|nr:hypothetical protein M0813_14701 [Anaeramoeba flamelloides]